MADVAWRRPTAPPSVLLDHIFWLHVPKCGGSLTHTIFSYACPGRKLDVDGQGTHHPRSTCGGNISSLQAFLTHGNYHVPLPWLNAFRVSQAVGNVVGMFRQPSQRLLSAFYHMREKPWCCHVDWGLGAAESPRRLALGALRNASDFASAAGMLGCQTKMLAGRHCCDLQPLSRAEITRVSAFVLRGMAFVGLLEEWRMSICLFHARFGGPLRVAELSNVRPTHTGRALGGRYDESQLGAVRDSADEQVYAAATARLWGDVRASQTLVDGCMEATKSKAG